MRCLKVVFSTLLSLLIVAVSPASGLAQSETEIRVVAPDLGLPGSVTLERPAASRELAVPVPDGMKLSLFRAELRVPAEVHQARVNISLDGVEVFQEIVSGGETLPVDLELETDSSEPLIRIAAIETSNRSCSAVTVEPVLVSVWNAVFGFSGVPRRADTVGGFFPAHLEHLDIFVPAERGGHIDQAALQLAAQLTRRYDAQPSFAVHEYSGAVPATSGGPFGRVVRFAEASAGKVSVESGSFGSYLEIAGDDSILTDLARTVGSPEVALLSGAEIDARALHSAAPASEVEVGQNWTLEELGLRSLETEGALSLQIVIPMEQSRFGGPISSIRAHLSGFVTAGDTDPVVTVALNGDTTSVLGVDEDGRFDTVVQIEGAQLGRDNTLTVQSEVDFSCEDTLPWHQLRLSAESEIEVEFGQTLMPGLERFPQVVLDGLSVAPGASAPGLEVSVNAIASLQQSSPSLIHPTVAEADAIIDSEGAGLIVADSAVELSKVSGLIRPDLGRIATGGVEYSGSGEAPVSIIQATVGPTGQDLLIVHLADENADLLIAELAGQRWDLKGTAVGYNQDTPVQLSGTDSNSPAGPLGFVDDEPRSVVQSFGLGLAGAALLFGLFSLVGSVRRRLS